MKTPKRTKNPKPVFTEEDKWQLQVNNLTNQLRASDAVVRQMAREKARRTDQYKALLQVANILLVVASNEIVRKDTDD